MLTRNKETLCWELSGEKSPEYTEPPEPVLEAIGNFITADNPTWEGTATELIEKLELDIKPNALSLKLNINAGKLYNLFFVQYSNSRSHKGRKITLRYDEENKKTILVDTPFEWNNPISFDTEGRTKGKVCGMRLGWLPEGWGTGYTQTAYDVIAQRDAEQAQSLPQDERELVVYTYDLFAVQDVRKDYSVQCMSANTVAGCDFLCGGTRTEITKQGTIGPYDASWVETHWQRSSPGSDAPEEWTTQMLLLYDPEKLCVVIISADWDDAERIAANLEIVETSVDTPQPDLTNGRGFRWIGGVG